MTHFHAKNVLITGAASGIGKLMAQKMAARGARIIAWDINEAGLAQMEEEFGQRGYPIATYVCNLADKEMIKQVGERVLDDLGHVDVLINNAGIVQGKNLLDASEKMIELTFAVNTMSLFWTTRAFLPTMMRRNLGHIVTIASAGGIVATAKMTDYSASKFAAVGFDEALRLELAKSSKSVLTTVVCPYYINTGMFAGVKTRFPWLLPIMEPDDVAEKIVNAIEKNRRRLILPPFAHAVFPARLLPVPAADWLMGFFGINKSMDEFTGREGH